MQSDVDAPKKAKEDLTNQGTAVVSNGKLDLVDPQPTHAGADANPALSPADILAGKQKFTPQKCRITREKGEKLLKQNG